MNNTHTPGPWKAELYEGTNWDGHPYAKWEIFACDSPETYVAGANEDNDDAAANARLIAAAPELLEALVELVSDVEEDERGAAKLLFRAKAAIAKATGGQP